MRDVAKAHLLAAQKSNVNGQRFLIVAKGQFAIEATTLLRKHYGRFYTINDSKLKFPCLIYQLAPYNEKMHNIKTRLGGQVTCDTTASREILGLEYRSVDQGIVDMFYSLVEAGLIENRLPKNFERPKL